MKNKIEQLKLHKIMASVQTFQCKEEGCNEHILFDPTENIISSLNESFSFKKKEKITKEVTAYLTCSKNHTHSYRVTKIYEI
jgi:hypothetical protein